MYGTHYAVPHLRKSKGKIVVMASTGASITMPRISFYNVRNLLGILYKLAHSSIFFFFFLLIGFKYVLSSGKQGSPNILFWDIKNWDWFKYWNNYCDSWTNWLRNNTRPINTRGRLLRGGILRYNWNKTWKSFTNLVYVAFNEAQKNEK